MDYLNLSEIKPGNIVKIYHSNKFEGYATLLEPFGEGISYMINDADIVYGKQRWLIEWAGADSLPPDASKEEIFNQKFLFGKRTHRFVHCKISNNWKHYWRTQGRLKNKTGINDRE